MNDTPILTAQLAALRIIPVVVLHDAAAVEPLAQALQAGGLPCMEITFRTDAAAAAIRAATRIPGMLVGAGTVLTVTQAQSALDAGAQFIVCPGFGRAVVEFCLARNMPVFPGISSATDLQAALDSDVRVVKYFPAEALGGIALLKALAAPFPMLRFIPTGGITQANVADYLRLPCVLACGGTWMVRDELIRAAHFDQITALTAQAVATRDTLARERPPA